MEEALHEITLAFFEHGAKPSALRRSPKVTVERPCREPKYLPRIVSLAPTLALERESEVTLAVRAWATGTRATAKTAPATRVRATTARVLRIIL